ncbi:MAG: M1 family aminopeptidase, partial [Candidatus Latescibacterota bacterium]
EVVHNWWGNCVYPDHETGNWCEGLTTYYADYRYEAEKGDSAASVYRRDILIDYATYVSDTTDIPLTSFRSREDDVSGTVGYGKCTMVFHMLKNQVGEDRYYRAMRNFFRLNRFQVAGWKDIECAMEEAYGGPLDVFFRQWVERTGAPRLSIREVTLNEEPDEEGRYALAVELGNEGGFVLPKVPVEIVGPTATRRISVPVTGDTVVFDWRLDERPLRLAVDPDYDIFRRMSPIEIPVTISGALAGESAVVVLPSGADPEVAAAYEELAGRLAGAEGTVVVPDTAVTDLELKSRPVFVLGGGGENDVWDRLDPPEGVVLSGGDISVAGRSYPDPGHAVFVAFANTLDPDQTACAIVGNSADAIRAAGYKVIYYGKYGYVTFLDGKKQAAGEFPPPPGPLVYTFDGSEPVNESGREAGE